MSIEEQLAELLAQLGVVLEGTEQSEPSAQRNSSAEDHSGEPASPEDGTDTCPLDLVARQRERLTSAPALSLFQTSREHYGVFYRLDLVDGLPQLRVFLPEDDGALKMRCYVICASDMSPLRDWFESAHLYEGSPAFDEARDIARQHLLFAAGELMKKLFWSGEMISMRFPDEIEVLRVA